MRPGAGKPLAAGPCASRRSDAASWRFLPAVRRIRAPADRNVCYGERPINWPRSQKVNRQSRPLLIILIAAAVFIPYWLMTRETSAPPPPGRERVTRPGNAAPPIPARGGTLIVSSRNDARSFNRIVSRDFPSEIVALLTQGRLVRINRATQELEPWLAEKWTTSPDGRTHTLTLREGVKWSDGVPFTSADVVFTFDIFQHPKSGAVLASSFYFDGKPVTATAPDARTVVITYPTPFAPGLRQLDNVIIAPKHKLEGALKDGRFAEAWSAATSPSDVVGLGPFKLARYEPGQRIVYERNPYFWRRDERGVQLPYLDGIVQEIVPEQDAEMIRLQSGQIHFTQQQLRATDIAPMRQLADQGKIQLMDLGVAPDPDHFFINLRPASWTKDPRADWIQHRELRQAIMHAIDREAFANTVFLGEAVPIRGPVTPGNIKWFWPNLQRYEFSLEKARALLASIGLENRDADEWLEHGNGSEARFSLLTLRGATVLERSAQVIRDDLRRVGIAIDIVTLEGNTVFQRMVAGDFESILVAFQGDLDPALNKDFWLSSGSAHVWDPSQPKPHRDWEQQIDELMVKQAATLDENERKRLFNEVQRIFAENLPIMHFAAPRIYIAVSPSVINMSPAPQRPQLLWSADTLALRPQ